MFQHPGWRLRPLPTAGRTERRWRRWFHWPPGEGRRGLCLWPCPVAAHAMHLNATSPALLDPCTTDQKQVVMNGRKPSIGRGH